MRRLLTGIAGAVGLAALLRALRRRLAAPSPPQPPAPDPAAELREKLAQARGAADDRDEFDAAEGVTVDEAGDAGSLDERRRAVHDRAQQMLGQMRADDDD
jgi:hypothetical protein